MHGQRERVLVGVQPPEPCSEQLPRVHRDRLRGLVPHGLLEVRARQIGDRELDCGRLDHDLMRGPGGGDDPRAQRLVPADDLGQGPRERGDVEGAGEQPGVDDAVRRAARDHAVEEPHAPLRVGQRLCTGRGLAGRGSWPPSCPPPSGRRCRRSWAARTWRAAEGLHPPPRASWPPRESPVASGRRARRSCRGRPRCSRPSTSRQIAARRSSVGVRGRSSEVSSRTGSSGAGNDRRSSLPLEVRGSDSSWTKAVGTMYFGSSADMYVRSSGAASSLPSVTRYATSRGSLDPSVRAITAAWRTAGWVRRAASISAGSMRKPRILSWWSARPR